MKKMFLALFALLQMAVVQAQKFAYGTGTDLWGGAPTVSNYKDAVRLGFTYIELAPGAYGSGSYEQIVSGSQATLGRLKEAGARVWSVHLPYGNSYDISVVNEQTRRATVERLATYMRALADVFHPMVMVLHPSGEPVPDAERDGRIKNAATSVGELYPVAQELGVTLCVENLPRTCLGNTPEELMSIVGPTPGVKICFDTNHYLKGTTESFIRKLGHLIGTVHLSDFDYTDERHWLPTLGRIAWGELLLELEEAGYEGVMMSEAENTLEGKATIEGMKEAYDAIFAQWAALKADPQQRLAAYVKGIDEQYFADGRSVRTVFPAGAAPGCYPEESVADFEKVYAEAQRAAAAGGLTADGYAQLRQQLGQQLEALKSAIRPMAEGYYFVESGHTGFATAGKTMAWEAGEDGILKWGPEERALKNLFLIQKLPEGGYAIEHVGTGTYVNTVAGTSSVVPLSRRQETMQLIEPFNQMGLFSICNTENALPYHAAGHAEGAGTSGNIVTWNGTAGSGSSWRFVPVDEATVEKLRATMENAADRLAYFLDGVEQTEFQGKTLDEALPVGTDPGCMTAEGRAAFETLWQEAWRATQTNLDMTGYWSHREAIEAGLEALASATVPVSNGYYWLQSAHVGFAAEGKTIGCYADGDLQLRWKAFSREASFLWRIRALAGGGFSIQNMGNGAFIASASGTSAKVPMSQAPQVAQLIEAFGRFGMVCLYNADNDLYYHTDGHREGAGNAGNIVTWDGVPGSGSSWRLLAVSDEEAEQIIRPATGVESAPRADNDVDGRVYTIDGRHLGGVDAATLPAGFYVIGGRKVIVP